MSTHSWYNIGEISPHTYTCGYCGKVVGQNMGFHKRKTEEGRRIYVCPFCEKPTFVDGDDSQTPAAAYGEDVHHLPAEVDGLYREARNCMSVSAHTSAVLACRKLLMNVAVAQGAKPGETFVKYVDYLEAKGFVPPNGRQWVDHIRSKGNEATHEIHPMKKEDAENLITFVSMLLKFVYEFPNRLPPTSP